jgi:acyl-CoA hydrolase
VTEYGIAYLHGKNIRERAMDLIAIAHPKFRPWLIEEARKRLLIYKDQAFIAQTREDRR